MGKVRRAVRKVSAKSVRLGKCKNQTTLLKKYEKIMKPIIIARDGGICGIRGYRHTCSGDLQVDHRPSKRKNHSTFLDPRNLTTVCGDANFLAEKDPFISHRIIEVVKNREGDVIEEINIQSRQSKKWSQEECSGWVELCRKHFETNKNGKPEEV